jgi:RND family efflux transporter MFP subunit
MSDAIQLNAAPSISRVRRFGAALCVWGLLLPHAHLHADEPVQAMLQAAEEATLSSRLAGQIKVIGVKAGDRFTAGQKLVQFDCAIGEQEARKARAELDIAKATFASNLKLKELNSISDLEVAIARAQQDKAQAEVDRAAAQLHYCTLSAPYAGRVVARHCNPLENVTIGQPLLDIVALGTPTIQMFVPSAWLAWLRPGLEFEVAVRETGTRHKARIERVGARVDAVSQTVELFAAFVDANPDLLPGMSGSAFLSAPASP